MLGRNSVKAIHIGIALLACTGAAAQAAYSQVVQQPTPQQLVAAWDYANSKCRGGSGDSPATWRACDEREALSKRLEAMGHCYGKHGEFGYQHSWHRCTPTSCGIIDC